MLTHWRLKQTAGIMAGIAAAFVLLALFAEETARAGLSLFRHVANSYLVMFVDSMNGTFLCF